MPDDISEVLEDAPSNWGRWGDEDEAGAVNYLTAEQVLRGIAAVERGAVFTLGVPIGREGGDPMVPSREAPRHYMHRDKGHYEAGKAEPVYAEAFGGVESADDVLFTFLQGPTHVDALGHAWYDDELYNGFDASTTTGGLERCSIEPIADHGIVGRGVLLDVAGHRGVDYLAPGERITIDELEACAEAQGVDVEPRDVPLVRTGWTEAFYDGEGVYDGDMDEPGLTYSPAVVEWFHELEIPAFGTDTLANEQSHSATTGTRSPLHAALLRDQGVAFTEILDLGELAADCADDGTYDLLYVGAPLKIVGATGSPVNPIAIK